MPADATVVLASTAPPQEECPSTAEIASFSPASTAIEPTTRTSLQASTWDGIGSAIFSNMTGGVLLSNFLVGLHANTLQIGLIVAVPMVVNLIQPLGAYLANCTTSRWRYGLWVYGPARLLWLILALGILGSTWVDTDPDRLLQWTCAIVLVSHVLGALGSASWLSWMVALVPSQLRGRYFGFRNSAVSLATLICIPLAGWSVSAWPGGSIEGYGVILLLGILAGLVSLGCQSWIRDDNPHAQEPSGSEVAQVQETGIAPRLWQDSNLRWFLIYFGFWALAINLSSPFYNIYLLDNLALDIRWVSVYNSLTAGTNLLMLIFWGRLSDRIGNRPILISLGIFVAITPLFWLGVGLESLDLWLWLPLLHILMGATWPAIELCSNNLQMAIAPLRNRATFFAIAAAVAGGCGAAGTLVGGTLAQWVNYGGLPAMFALSSGLRLVALVPLIWVHEDRGQSVLQIARAISAGIRPSLKPLPIAPARITEELNS